MTTNHVTTTDTFDTVRAALVGMPGLPPDAGTAEPFPLPVAGRWANPPGRCPSLRTISMRR